MQHWVEIMTIFSYIVTAASIIAKFTPSKVDDEVIDWLRRFIDSLAMNRNRERIAEENR